MHFCMMVFTKNGTFGEVDALMAPYNECDERYYDCSEEYDGEIYQYNSNAKWDWWQQGGRYANNEYIPEGLCDGDPKRVGDVDWSYKRNQLWLKACEHWDTYVEKSVEPSIFDKKAVTQMSNEWARKTFGSKKLFAAWYAMPAVGMGFIDSDGDWHGGMDIDTPEERQAYIDDVKQYISAHPDEYVTVLDCHI